MILRSGIICAIIYGALIIGIVLVIPKTGPSNVSGFVDAYSAVSGVFHSHALNVVFAIGLIVTLLASGAVWLEGADRTQAIASLDGAGPKWMGRFTRRPAARTGFPAAWRVPGRPRSPPWRSW